MRLSRCNLACVWCDTAYNWHFTGDNRPHRDDETYERAANQVTLDEEDTASRIAALGQPRLVVTGGEPLLQAPALARMLAALPPHDPPIRVEVETNGTVAPPPALDALSSVATRLEQRYQDTGSYADGAACGVAMPAAQNFTLSCVISGGGQGFTATATGDGPMAGYSYTINHQGVRVTTAHPKGTPATNCWSMKGKACDA